MMFLKAALIWALVLVVFCIAWKRFWDRIKEPPPEIELEEVERLRRIQKATKIIE